MKAKALAAWMHRGFLAIVPAPAPPFSAAVPPGDGGGGRPALGGDGVGERFVWAGSGPKHWDPKYAPEVLIDEMKAQNCDGMVRASDRYYLVLPESAAVVDDVPLGEVRNRGTVARGITSLGFRNSSQR